MFQVYCTQLGGWVLVWACDLRGVTSQDGRHTVRYRCACGRDETTVIEAAGAVPARRPTGPAG